MLPPSTTEILNMFVGTYVPHPELDVNYDKFLKLHGIPQNVIDELKDSSSQLRFEWTNDGRYLIHGAIPHHHPPVVFRPHHPIDVTDYFGRSVRAVFSVREPRYLILRTLNLVTHNQLEWITSRDGDILIVRGERSDGAWAKRFFKKID